MMEINDDQRPKSPTRTATNNALEARSQEVKDQPSLKKGPSNAVTPVHNIKPIISITPVLSSPSASSQHGKSSPVPSSIIADRNSPSLGCGAGAAAAANNNNNNNNSSSSILNPLSLLAHVSSNSGRKTTASPLVAANNNNSGASTPTGRQSRSSSPLQATPIALNAKHPSSPLSLVTNGKAQVGPKTTASAVEPSKKKRPTDGSDSDSHTGASSDASVCSDLSHESGDETRGGKQQQRQPARSRSEVTKAANPSRHNVSKSLAQNIEKLHQKHQDHTSRHNLDGKLTNMGFPIGLSSSITLTPVAPASPPLNAPLNLSMKPVSAAPPPSNSSHLTGLSGLSNFYNNVLSMAQPNQAHSGYKGAKRGPKPKHIKAAMLEGVNHLRQRQEELAHLEAQIKMHEMQRMLDQAGALNYMNHHQHHQQQQQHHPQQLTTTTTPPRIHIQTSVGRGKSVVITTTSPSSTHSESPNSRLQQQHQHHNRNHQLHHGAQSSPSPSPSRSRSVSLLAGNSRFQELPSTSVNHAAHQSSRGVRGHSRRALQQEAAAAAAEESAGGGSDHSHSTVEEYRGGRGGVQGAEEDNKIVAKFKTLDHQHHQHQATEESDEEESSDEESSGETGESSCGSNSSGGESEGSTSDTERSRETTSSASKGRKRDYSSDSTPSRKRRKYIVTDERELRIPLEYGWRRVTKIRMYSFSGVRGEVAYFGPCGKKLKTYPEVVRYLEKNGMNDITRENFTFSSKHNVGEFLEPQGNGEYLSITEADVICRIEEFRVHKGRRYAPVSQRRLDKRRQHAAEKQRKKEEARMQRQLEEQAAEARRQKEHLRFLRQQERMERQELQRVTKESKAQQVFEARKKRQELLEKQRVEENVRKNKERELKRLQAVVLREQELQKRREMLIMVDLERERRRQHMLLVKALEARKRQEERERMKEERIVEKQLNRERKLEQRRMELHMIREMKKPVEDMELADAQPLPTLNRMPGVKLSGKAFADILMVFEFLHNFGETLGFDMVSLPTLNTLQMALLNDEGCEEELLSVLHHLLICAIDDPGLPQGIKGATAVGQSLKEVDVTSSTVSEILRIYIHANEGEKCKMLEWIAQRPFIALTPTQKAAIVAYLCNELLCSRNICRQIDNNIETVNGMRRDKWVAEGKVRQLKTLQAKKIAHREMKTQLKEGKQQQQQQVGKPPTLISQDGGGKNEGGGGGGAGGRGSPAVKERSNHHEDNEEVRNDSGNESEESHNTGQLEVEDTDEPEDDGESVEDLGKKIDRFSKQQNLFRRKLLKASQQLRAISLGQDRFRRRYWLIPHGGGVFVEGMESAELQEEPKEEPSPPAETAEEEVKSRVIKSELAEEGRECNKIDIEGNDNEDKKESMDCDRTANVFPATPSIDVKTEVGVEFEKEVGEEPMTLDEDQPMDVGPKNTVEPEQSGVDDSTLNKTPAATDPEAQLADSMLGLASSSGIEAAGGPPKSGSAAGDETADSGSNVVSGKSAMPSDQKQGPASTPGLVSAGGQPKGGDAAREQDLGDRTLKESHDLASGLATPKEEDLRGFAAAAMTSLGSGLFPTIPQYQVCAEQILRTLTERHGGSGGQQQQQQQPWFSLLPRMPCDETSLTRIHSDSSTSKSAPQGRCVGGTTSLASRQYNPFGFYGGSPMVMVNGTSPYHPSYLMPSPYIGGSPGFAADFGSSYPSHCRNSGGFSPYGSYGYASPIDQRLLEQFARHQKEQREPQDAKPIPIELQKGWWRITDGNQLRAVAQALHPRGIREKMLHVKLLKYLDIACDACGKAGNHSIIDLEITDLDREISQKPGGAPEADRDWDWNRPMALRADLAILEQVENMEEKIASASMQVKGWKLPMKITDDENIHFYPSCEPPPPPPLEKTEEEEDATGDKKNAEKIWLCPLTTARQRLLDLEENIERRYMKPPLGYSTGQVNIHSMSSSNDNQASSAAATSSSAVDVVNDEDIEGDGEAEAAAASEDSPQRAEVPEGLLRWRAAVQKTRTSAQLAVCLNFMEGSIAWDRSIMKASCQFCNSGDNEAMLLLCDGCDKGYHTYCFKPKMETIPEGDWFCVECRNKATGDRACLFCGKKGKNICSCDNCPKAFHIECMEPPMPRLPKGRWLCQHCSRKSSNSKGKGKSRKSNKDSKDAGFSEIEDSTPKKSEKAAAANKADKSKDRSKMPVNKDLELCRVVLAELETHEDAWPFLLPVNIKQFPSYRKVIKKPMDLSTIRGRLENGSLKSRADFLANVRLMFDNCETFNEDDSPVGKAGHNLRAYFETRWFDVADK